MVPTDSEVGSLKAALNCWEWFGYISTAIVFVGCVGEFVAEFTSLPKTKDSGHKLARLSLIVLLVGIAGELLSTVRTSQLSGLVIANIEDRAGKAEQKAGEANDRASVNEKEAERLRKDAEGFKLDIARANERAATAGRQAAEANQVAESERLARVNLQKELQPRRLTTAQKEKVTSLLRDKPLPIGIMWAMDGTEAADFADDIGDALNKAGWKTYFGTRATHEHGIQIGTMKGSDLSILMPEIERLKQALSTVGFSSRTTMFDPGDNHSVLKFEKNVLYLVIDHKPEIKPAP
jgi:hypothetical protein